MLLGSPKRPLSDGPVRQLRFYRARGVEADDADNTLILMQYVKNLGVDESQMRETLGIGQLSVLDRSSERS